MCWTLMCRSSHKLPPRVSPANRWVCKCTPVIQASTSLRILLPALSTPAAQQCTHALMMLAHTICKGSCELAMNAPSQYCSILLLCSGVLSRNNKRLPEKHKQYRNRCAHCVAPVGKDGSWGVGRQGKVGEDAGK